MKKFIILPLIAALAFFVSCQKQQTEEERKAEVERQVQERVAAERLQDEKQRLAQQQADLEAREKALATENSTPAEADVALAEGPLAATTPRIREPAETATETRADTRSEQRSTASYGMFYRKLEPHGAWRETADYGYVWQPREAEESRDWRPYTEGRWVYSDAGWTWVSDEPFGWATYHYGRWLRLRRVGWVWVPGDEWAPAWVSWRTSKDYVGWAPLPPEARFDRRSGIHAWADSYYDIGPDQYAFVPNNEFGDEHVRRSVIPAERNVTIVIETTNVTNITYANTTIVNQGPNYEEMRSRSRRPLERYRLRRQNVDGISATIRGDELDVSVPVIVEIPDMPRPRTVKERVTEVTIDNGWTAIADRSAAERARTKMRADATPPPNAPPKNFVKPTEASTTTVTPAATAAATTAPGATAAATATTAASATPAASPSVRTRPSPSATAAPSAKPAATAKAAASPTPAASPSPKVRPSPAATPKASPSATPASAPSASAKAPAATPSPKAIASPPTRVRPSPSIAPAATATINPPATPKNTPAVKSQPPIPPRPVNTPAPTGTPPRQPESVSKPKPTLTPVTRPPASSPRAPLPTPAATPQTSVAAPAITPPPKQIMPRATPPIPATTPATSPVPRDEKPKNKRPKSPGSAEGETATPTPSTPPN